LLSPRPTASSSGSSRSTRRVCVPAAIGSSTELYCELCSAHLGFGRVVVSDLKWSTKYDC
jgi:hypothetical protein